MTQEMLKIVATHIKSNEEDLLGRVVDGPSLGTIDLHQLSQLRGQILALKEVLNIKEYLIQESEEQDTDE